jgi:hypothetical protein
MPTRATSAGRISNSIERCSTRTPSHMAVIAESLVRMALEVTLAIQQGRWQLHRTQKSICAPTFVNRPR